jgi:deoxyribodipyrimidine photo-lyase
MKISIFWFRRDLRIEDNTALIKALSSDHKILPLFIFDEEILNDLPLDDPRISFIYKSLKAINEQFFKYNSSILCVKGKPLTVWKELLNKYAIINVFINKEYEPYTLKRDQEIENLLITAGIKLKQFKDQVIHEGHEVVKGDEKPYTVFTPYKNKWLDIYSPFETAENILLNNLLKINFTFPSLNSLGFKESSIKVKPFNLKNLNTYAQTRDFPSLDATSYLGPHLRYGTISIRQVISQLNPKNDTFLSELIWREFFMQILFHFPYVVTNNFRSKYDNLEWRNNPDDFQKWRHGETGYPMVDAGMRQLNETGYMHNRVRMIAAGFLCKHLLIDWKLGEAYFAEKLLDYELSSNNGNWQWAAGTGCDAAPYFRIFNPAEQLKKFDKTNNYIRKWIPEYETEKYICPMVDHKFARIRALETYKRGLMK